MLIIFMIVCVALFAIYGMDTSFGVSCSHLAGAFTYQFMHTSWLHLIINMLSLGIMYKPICDFLLSRFRLGGRKWFLIFIAYIGSALAALFTAVDVVTLGCSGMVFFLLGVLLMLRPTRRQLRSFIYVVLAVGISIFTGKSNVPLHILSFVFGCLFVIGYIAYDDRRREIDRQYMAQE